MRPSPPRLVAPKGSSLGSLEASTPIVVVDDHEVILESAERLLAALTSEISKVTKSTYALCVAHGIDSTQRVDSTPTSEVEGRDLLMKGPLLPTSTRRPRMNDASLMVKP